MNEKAPNILIIEDEELLLKAITTKLSNLNMKTTAFQDPRDALDFLDRNTDQIPDLIWLDYYLTEMDGLDFMKELKKRPQLTNVPVIVVSNSANQEKINSMLSLGVKKYILKADYRLEDIANIIYQLIQDKGKTNE